MLDRPRNRSRASRRSASPSPSGGVTAGLKVSIFLSSSGVDLVRKRAADTTQVDPARAARQSHQRLHGARRDDLGVHAMRGGARLWSGGPPRRRCYQRRERGPRQIKTGAATLSFRAVPAQFEPSLSWRCRFGPGPAFAAATSARAFGFVHNAAPRPVPRPNRARRDRRQTAPRHADGTGEPRCRARRH